MPESVTDRPTRAHEYVFLLTKAPRYYYDAEAIRESLTGGAHGGGKDGRKVALKGRDGSDHRDTWVETYKPINANKRTVWNIPTQSYSESNRGQPREHTTDKQSGRKRYPTEMVNGIRNIDKYDDMSSDEKLAYGANKRTVWSIQTQAYSKAHFATFPEKLVEPCILAGTSEHGVCGECGAPWQRVVKTSGGTTGTDWAYGRTDEVRYTSGVSSYSPNADIGNGKYKRETTGWQPTCDHNATIVPATVLDPFAGSGTTCAVSQRLGRQAVGLDLNKEYLDLAAERIMDVPLPLMPLG